MSNETHQPDHQPSNNNIDHNNPSILPYPSDETTTNNRPYQQFNQTKQPTYTFEDYQHFENQAALAIYYQEQAIHERRYRYSLEDNPSPYLIRPYRSQYQIDTIIDSYNGDIPKDRFWYESNIHQIDKTTNTLCYAYPTLTTDDLETPVNVKSHYKEIILNLSPHITEREYGRVYFSTATKYVHIDSPPYLKRKIKNPRGYIVYKTHKIFCPVYVRPPSLYYITKGILKIPTVYGYIATKILNNLNLLRYNRQLHPYRTEGSIAFELFHTIRNDYNFQIHDWALNTPFLEPPDYDEHIRDHLQQYENSEISFYNQLDTIRRNLIQYNYFAKTIQRFWRIQYFRRKRSKRIILKYWIQYINNNKDWIY